jgi:hypothetical protein
MSLFGTLAILDIGRSTCCVRDFSDYADSQGDCEFNVLKLAVTTLFQILMSAAHL